MVVLLAGRALGGAEPTISLPADSAPEAWRDPLALAGLALATTGSSADVSVRATAGAWVIEVAGPEGAARSLRLAAPGDEAAREDLAVIAASLLEEVRLNLPPRRPLEAADRDAVVEVPEPPPPLVLRPLESPLPPLAMEAQASPAAEPLDRPTAHNGGVLDPAWPQLEFSGTALPRPWLHLGVAASLRAETTATPAMSLGMGVLDDSGLEAGLQLAWLRHELQALEGERGFDDRSLLGFAGYVHGHGWLRPLVRGSLGGSWRGYWGQRGLVESHGVPLVGLELGARAILGLFEFQLGPAVTVDLADTSLRQESGLQAELAPWELQLGLRLGTTARRNPRSW